MQENLSKKLYLKYTTKFENDEEQENDADSSSDLNKIVSKW